MKAIRATVDMVAVFRSGELPEPVRFRYEDREGKETVIKVGEVTDLRIDRYSNGKNITYTCVSLVGRRQLKYELKYIGNDIRWELYKVGEI